MSNTPGDAGDGELHAGFMNSLALAYSRRGEFSGLVFPGREGAPLHPCVRSSARVTGHRAVRERVVPHLPPPAPHGHHHERIPLAPHQAP